MGVAGFTSPNSSCTQNLNHSMGSGRGEDGQTDRYRDLSQRCLPPGKRRVGARSAGGGRPHSHPTTPLPNAATYEDALGTKKSTAKPK